MSVLQSIKGTIANVQQDISSSLKSLRSPTKPDIPGETAFKSTVHCESSAELLDHYQKQWREMHENAEGNASAAQDVDASVTEIFLHLERQNEAVNQFHDEVVKIPQIVSDIKNVMDKIGEMEVLFSEVNEGLADLEDIEEEHKLLRDMHQHHTQLKLYAQKQKSQTEQLRRRLSADHAYKVQVHEAKLQGTLREKQEAMEEAFSEEMQNYKKFGQTQFKPSEKKVECSLADISIEDDGSSELNDFLRSQELTDNTNLAAVAEKSEEEEEEENKVDVKTDEDFVTNET